MPNSDIQDMLGEVQAVLSTPRSDGPEAAVKKMRDALAREMASMQQAYGKIRQQPARVLDIELVLEIMRRYFPGENPTNAWAVLNGHNFPAFGNLPLDGRRALAITRQRLIWLSGRETWESSLRAYKELPDPYPFFRLSATGVEPTPSPLMLQERTEYIQLALKTAPPRQVRRARYAESGLYRFTDGRNAHEVEIPPGAAEIAKYLVPPLDTAGKPSRTPIRISKNELMETAIWMDQNAPEGSAAWGQDWTGRVDVLLRAVTPDGLRESDELVLDGLQHMLGMVGSGKSSLLTVLAVYLARLGYKVTMVAGDVVSLLREQAVFDALRPLDARLHAVPLIGRSTRLTHLQRLHITEALRHGPSLEGRHPAFESLSLVCPLDGLRKDVRPVTPGNEPCTRLQLVEETDDGTVVQESKRDCPLMPICPVHNPSRSLASANLWLATPASLLASSPQVPLVSESMQFVELVMRHSDVVLVDEADLMQVQFDDRFAPTETLVGDSDGILDRLASQVAREVYTPGRPLIGSRADLDDWLTEHQKVQATVNRIYKWLRERPDMRDWLERTYFYGDRLLDKVGIQLKKMGVETTNYQLTRHSYRRAPLVEFSDTPIDGVIRLAGPDAYASPESPRVATPHAQWTIAVQDEILHGQTRAAITRLTSWMRSKLNIPESVDDLQLADAAQKLLFALMVVVLESALRNTIEGWPVAAEVLDIDRGTGALFYQPNESIVKVVPEAPMGPVFGFQYTDAEKTGRGTLRFFRVSGVGRDLLYHLHDAFHLSHNIVGPHVLLTSGTSWAPGSWKYHLGAGPHAVLLPRRSDHTADTYCAFEPLPDADRPDKALYISGKSSAERLRALRAMVVALTEDRGLRRSRFEEELALLPETRRRILVVVGSYDEAGPVGELLASRMEKQDDVLILKRDPDGFGEDHWQTPKGYLLRSMLNQMPTYSARFLVAPLQAVERGHNILVGEEAAIGSVYFLVRPMPVPFDPLTAVQKMNAWVADYVVGLGNMPVSEAGIKLRSEAHRQWSRVMGDSEQYGGGGEAAHSAVLWTQLVLTWQCIGRLLRGGVPARVHFIDGKWAPARAGLVPNASVDNERSSMLLGFRRILRDALADPDPAKREIAHALYGSFAAALENLHGLPGGRPTITAKAAEPTGADQQNTPDRQLDNAETESEHPETYEEDY